MSGEDQGDRTALLAAATAKAMAADDADEKAEATDSYGSTKENGTVQDLFHEETQAWAWGAWWKAKLLARKPSLFGTWTGVFTSCLVNILGVVLFLRTGYVVSAAGSRTPWWRSQFFVREPVLFGMWDGVFTSCMINIFGVVIFLRTGWLVVGWAGTREAPSRWGY